MRWPRRVDVGPWRVAGVVCWWARRGLTVSGGWRVVCGGRGPHHLPCGLSLAKAPAAGGLRLVLGLWSRGVGAEGDGEAETGRDIAGPGEVEDADAALVGMVELGAGWSAVGVGVGTRHRGWL